MQLKSKNEISLILFLIIARAALLGQIVLRMNNAAINKFIEVTYLEQETRISNYYAPRYENDFTIKEECLSHTAFITHLILLKYIFKNNNLNSILKLFIFHTQQHQAF